VNHTLRTLASLTALAIVATSSMLWSLFLEKLFERACKALARRMSDTRIGKAVLHLSSQLNCEARRRARLVLTVGSALVALGAFVLLAIFVMPKFHRPEPQHANAGCAEMFGLGKDGTSPATALSRDPESATTYGVPPNGGRQDTGTANVTECHAVHRPQR
jgi:hypothetical protein